MIESVASACRGRGILFSGPMVRALLAGAKTQTRRMASLPDAPMHLGHWEPITIGGRGVRDTAGGEVREFVALSHSRTGKVVASPYGVPGDRLWVREEHYCFGHWEPVPGVRTGAGRMRWRFVADDTELRYDPPPSFRKGRHHKDPATPAWHQRLGRFMPRRAARTVLEIIDVRAQRLQDISEEDARAEGVEPFSARFPNAGRDQRITSGELARDAEHRASFAVLWDEINGHRALWVSNPWVWAISFRRIQPEAS